MVEKFGSVKLATEVESEKGVVESTDKEDGRVGAEVQERNQRNVTEQGQPANILSFNIGSSHSCGRKFRRTKRGRRERTEKVWVNGRNLWR